MAYKELFYFSLTACLLCIDLTTDRLSLHLLSAPLITTFLLSWDTSFLYSRIRPFVQIVLGEILIVLCIIDCYCLIYLKTPITPQIVSTILLNEHREAKEFFSVFIGYHVLFQWRITCLLLMGMLFPFSYLIRWSRFSLGSNGIVWKWVKGLVLSSCFIYEISPMYKYLQLFRNGKDLQKTEGFIFRHYHEEVATPIHRFAFAYYASRQSAYMLSDMKRSTYSANIDSCSYQSPHIVLLIGESYNKHHSSLYGYHLETTPLQQKRMENGELFLFSDVVTPWNITSNVFVDIFSLWENGSQHPIVNYPLLPILFRRAGYAVNFFSNQYLLKGFRKGATNQAGHFFLADAEMSDSLFSYRNRKSSQFDMGLVGQIADYKNKQSEQPYTLDIIHLIGQHFDYSMRYPHSQATFSLSDYAKRPLTNEARGIVMHYDNATRYNDMVLDSLLTLYSREEAIVVFLADHGEEVYDEQPVHGRLFCDPTKDIATQEYEVPMWIWCSESYQANHQNIVDAIKASQDKPFITERLPQLLLALAGISCQWSNNSQDILSPQYKCGKRIIGGNTDYDVQTKSIGKDR